MTGWCSELLVPLQLKITAALDAIKKSAQRLHMWWLGPTTITQITNLDFRTAGTGTTLAGSVLLAEN